MTTKTPLPVSPKRIHDVDAFQVVRVGSDGMVYVRVEGEERALLRVDPDERSGFDWLTVADERAAGDRAPLVARRRGLTISRHGQARVQTPKNEVSTCPSRW